LYLNRITITYC